MLAKVKICSPGAIVDGAALCLRCGVLSGWDIRPAWNELEEDTCAARMYGSNHLPSGNMSVGVDARRGQVTLAVVGRLTRKT